MSAFTIFGILSYWVLMGLIGYAGGYSLCMYFDMRRGIKALLDPIDNEIREISVLVGHLTAVGRVKT